MRKMKHRKYDTILNVVEHIILKNFWEYYITDEYIDEENHIQSAVVMGVETESGDISLDEIRPYIISRTKKLNEIAPCEGFDWI